MFSHIKEILIIKNVCLEIKFHLELENLEDTYLKEKLAPYLINPTEGNIISGEELEVNLHFIDINAINGYIDEFILKDNSPAMRCLISKNIPTDNKSLTYGINAS